MLAFTIIFFGCVIAIAMYVIGHALGKRTHDNTLAGYDRILQDAREKKEKLPLPKENMSRSEIARELEEIRKQGAK